MINKKGRINKKRCIFRLGSQAATIRAYSKVSPSISTDAMSSEQVTAMQAKIQKLSTAEIQQKSLDRARHDKTKDGIVESPVWE